MYKNCCGLCFEMGKMPWLMCCSAVRNFAISNFDTSATLLSMESSVLEYNFDYLLVFISFNCYYSGINCYLPNYYSYDFTMVSFNNATNHYDCHDTIHFNILIHIWVYFIYCYNNDVNCHHNFHINYDAQEQNCLV